MSKKKLVSAIAPLRPHTVLDARTGESISLPIHDESVKELVAYVTDETRRLYSEQGETLTEQIIVAGRIDSANSFGRQRGYASNYKELPASVLAKSRINELVLHKLVSETASYAFNPNPRKKPPSFARKINLGAVDSQMASLGVKGSELTLLFKAWDREYLLYFTLPHYLSGRDIIKYSLPTVEYRDNVPYYIFTIQEQPKTRTQATHTAGVDLGRVKPYTAAVLAPSGGVVARYEAGGRVFQLNRKRERILVEKKHVLARIDAYNALGIDATVLNTEAGRLAGKARKLGKSIAQQSAAHLTKQLAKHKLNLVKVENLKWVTGPKYGGRWNHSVQQEAIEHALAREGITVIKVDPKNTSQTCHKCATPLVHNSVKRSVYCSECKTVIDRDFNAAINIAKKTKNRGPAQNSRNREEPSIKQFFEGFIPHHSQLSDIRNTT